MKRLRSVLVGISIVTMCACARAPERVTYHTLDSASEGRTMNYAVYTPPGWDGVTPLPLVVFLHGRGDDETVLAERAAVVRTFDAWIREGRLDPFILVVPNGDQGFWLNWHDGTHRYEDYVVDEIIPAMREHYPIAPGRENLHLMGISMGGAGTIYMAIHHMEMFASATVLSAPLFNVEETMEVLDGERWPGLPAERLFGPPNREKVEASNPYMQLRSAEDLQGTKLLLGVGRMDLPGLLPNNRRLHQYLVEHEIPHHYLEYRGGHGWRSWAQVFPIALCLQMRGESCELAEDRFYALELDERVTALAPGSRGIRPPKHQLFGTSRTSMQD